MVLQHVYQPLLIRFLIETGGQATLRQLAVMLLAEDESQVAYYTKRIREMPVKVLRRHGVLSIDKDSVFLTVRNLTYEQKARIRMLCEQRLGAFLEKRGLGLWDYRLGEDDPVPDSLRFQALKAAGGRCALCGATRDERPLDIDHIVPRSRKGQNTLDNLQVLCSKCNRAKGNRDRADFRELSPVQPAPGCPFCALDFQAAAIAENGSVFAVKDRYPITADHTLVVTRRHVADYFEMSGMERRQAEDLVRYMRNRILASDRAVVGFNVGTNCGDAAGQTIPHAHIHLIPRRRGDTSQPRGGVRGVIPERMSYITAP
jgi:diadenosine tetraphosphate (Ap4A) HIT family hydrolase/5-methylcytosine-specific restriction endonuclease McrA